MTVPLARCLAGPSVQSRILLRKVVAKSGATVGAVARWVHRSSAWRQIVELVVGDRDDLGRRIGKLKRSRWVMMSPTISSILPMPKYVVPAAKH